MHVQVLIAFELPFAVRALEDLPCRLSIVVHLQLVPREIMLELKVFGALPTLMSDVSCCLASGKVMIFSRLNSYLLACLRETFADFIILIPNLAWQTAFLIPNLACFDLKRVVFGPFLTQAWLSI